MRELRTEEEIVASWKGDVDKPVVSVCCTAYNHQNYIEDALVGALSQETDFPIEILVHDDASSDDTANVILGFWVKYPNIIKPIFQRENQYSKGSWPSSLLYKRAKGAFLAVCEGDDYWTDSKKLSLQVDALRKHPGQDLCIHKAVMIDCRSGERKVIGDYLSRDGIVGFEDVFVKRHGKIPAASTMFRKEVAREVCDFMDSRPWLTVGDIYLYFFGARRGGVYLVNREMSVYRFFSSGSWTEKLRSDPDKRIRHVSARVRAFSELDALTDGVYGAYFCNENKRWVSGVLKGSQSSLREKFMFFRDHMKYLGAAERVIYFPLAVVPGLAGVARYLYRATR